MCFISELFYKLMKELVKGRSRPEDCMDFYNQTIFFSIFFGRVQLQRAWFIKFKPIEK